MESQIQSMFQTTNQIPNVDSQDFLVGGIPTPLKNDGLKVSWDGYSIPNFLWIVPI